MRRVFVFFILSLILGHGAWAGCVSVDMVTKCARLPEVLGANIDFVPGDYTEDSWSFIYKMTYDGEFKHYYSGASAEIITNGDEQLLYCYMTSPFQMTITAKYDLENQPLPTSNPYEACSRYLTWAIFRSLSNVTVASVDVCPDGFYTVPYELSCGEGMVDVADIPNCDYDTTGDFCVMPVPCGAGYYVNESGACEICPAGYYCVDGVQKNECRRGMLDLSDTIGATSEEECVMHGIPAGKYVFCSSDNYSLRDCESGWYCPGTDDVITLGSMCSTFSREYGRELCPTGVGPVGAESEEDCCATGTLVVDGKCAVGECEAGFYANESGVCEMCPFGHYCVGGAEPSTACPAVPQLPEGWWAVVQGNIDYCSFMYFYGQMLSVSRYVDVFTGDYEQDNLPQDIVESDWVANQPVLIAILFGIPVMENPNYSHDFDINQAGAGVLTYTWNADAGKYEIGVMATGCHPGYWAEYGIRDMEQDPVLVNSVDEALEYMCKPVGMGYWGPGSVVDAEAATVSGGDERFACPSGTFTAGYGTGADSEDDCQIGCMDGFKLRDNQCVKMCAAGITTLNVGNGVTVSLWGEKNTAPALGVMYNNTVCWANAEPGQATNTINVMYNNQVYHLVD